MMADESDRARIQRTLDALEDEALGELDGLNEAEQSARGVKIARELGIDLDELAERIRARIARRREERRSGEGEHDLCRLGLHDAPCGQCVRCGCWP